MSLPSVTVKLFGPQAQLAQQRELAVEMRSDRASAAEVLAAIAVACPALSGSITTSKLAVNHEVADPSDPVTPGDEVALIGMLGGG